MKVFHKIPVFFKRWLPLVTLAIAQDRTGGRLVSAPTARPHTASLPALAPSAHQDAATLAATIESISMVFNFTTGQFGKQNQRCPGVGLVSFKKRFFISSIKAVVGSLLYLVVSNTLARHFATHPTPPPSVWTLLLLSLLGPAPSQVPTTMRLSTTNSGFPDAFTGIITGCHI